MNGGEAGIRTLGGDQPSTVFKTAAFGRSATSPQAVYNNLPDLKINYFMNYLHFHANSINKKTNPNPLQKKYEPRPKRLSSMSFRHAFLK